MPFSRTGPTKAAAVIAGAISLVALATLLASLIWLHLQPTGLRAMHNAVSQYGITKYRVGYRVATLAFAAAGVALAVGIDGRLHSRATKVEILLIVFAAARAAISWFPMDAPGVPPTQSGGTHRLLAIVAFGCATAAAFALSSVLKHGTLWHHLAPASSALGWVMLACLLAMTLRRSIPAAGVWFGAIERAFYLSAIVWFSIFAIACTSGHW